MLQAAKNPKKIARELNRIGHTRGYLRNCHPKSINIIEEDWDNLIILDACRYDKFKKINDINANCTYKYSNSSTTRDFIRNNFFGKKMLDTVYIGANSWYLKLKGQINSEIYKFVNLQGDSRDIDYAFDDLKVANPSTVTRYAKQNSNKHPQKRLIIHYLQPHHPFLGETGKQLNQTSSSISTVMSDSSVSRNTLMNAYEENLSIVLEEVKNLLSFLQGKTVVTADHGEMLGERHDYIPLRDYGHHSHIFNKPTIKIPWLKINNGARKEITSAGCSMNEGYDDKEIKSNLKDLGYTF
ncbi:hypothetical protein [Natronomonas marina]|uniref:hypothetical protein n=1 Tax=Natronomonas marina TaxID=2961939 RepID=UPI0020C93C5F|nr:hypothetical protein [Natronomonas marina]